MAVTLQAILQRSFPAYAERHKVPRQVGRAAHAIMTCRTAALGGHVRRCPAGHITEVWYNSCRHGAYPRCGAQRNGQWLDGWLQQLLSTDHFHVIFTLLSELHELWRWNRARVTEVLFSCVRQTLLTLLHDPQWLGAQVGILAALHTWSRTLAFHAHVHCLISGGGQYDAGTNWNDSEARAATYAANARQFEHRQSALYRWSLVWITVGVLCLALGTTPARGERSLALVGATIHPAPGASVISNGIVIVRNGVIAAIGTRDDVSLPTNADVLDCSSLSVTAGFWNSHVHFTPWRLAVAGWLPAFVSAGEVRAMLTRYGFVHVLDTGSLPGNVVRLRARIAQGRLVGPDIRIAAGSFVAPGGSPFYLWPLRLPELKTPAEARERVLRTLDAGADGIKLFTGGLAAPDSVIVMDTDIVRAATTAAHERGAFVVAHPSNSAGARAAIEGGVDILAHTFPSDREGSWDRSLLPRMKKAGMALIPTIKLWEYELRRAGRDRGTIERWIQVAQDQVRSFVALGGPILFGTDVGYMREYDPTDEYVYLAGAGLSFAQILTMLTTAPAERFKAASRTGRIAVGMDADLVVFDGDPRADIRSLARVRHVLHRGRLVYRDDARPRRE